MNNIGSEALASPNSGTKVPPPNKTNGTDTLVSDNGWRECKLGDVADYIARGISPKYSEIDGTVVVNQKCIRDGKINYEFTKVNDFSKKISGEKFLKQYDTLVNSTGVGTLGRVGLYDLENDKCTADSHVMIVRASGGIDKKWLFYNLFSRQDEIELLGEGSTGQIELSRLRLADLDVLLPPPEEQKAIVEVLSSLDNKIDLLHRQNRALESLAQTLFRQWFIEEAKDEWEIGKLPEEFDFTMGLSPSGDTYNEEQSGMPMFQGNADFEFRFPKNRVYTTDPKRIAKRFDTLISVRAPVGAQNMAKEKCCIGRGVACFRYRLDSSFYTYTYYKMHSLMEEIKQFNETGTVFGSIGKSDFEAIEIIKPPFEYVAEFQKQAKPIDDKIILNCEQIQTLENLRDTLLPKLLSGEARVEI